MVARPPVRRGDIWLINLDPTIGHEIRKTRPCLVVSPDAMNRPLSTFTVVPLTSASRPAPFRVPTRFKGKDGYLLPEQLRTIDRLRMIKRLGQAEPAVLSALLLILREMFEEE